MQVWSFGLERFPWRRKGQPIPVFLPGKSHGQRSLVGCSPRGCRVRCDLARTRSSWRFWLFYHPDLCTAIKYNFWTQARSHTLLPVIFRPKFAAPRLLIFWYIPHSISSCFSLKCPSPPKWKLKTYQITLVILLQFKSWFQTCCLWRVLKDRKFMTETITCVSAVTCSFSRF